MKTEITKLPKSEVELKIEVPAEEWQEFFDGAAKELSKNLKIEGFRPGFAPPKLVEEKIGVAGILQEAAEHCVKKCYVGAILENNVEAIGQPEISILKLAKDNPFEFKARVAVMPEVKLPDYKKIASRIKRNKVSVQDKEVDEALLWLQKSRAKLALKSGPCQTGDWVEIEYSSPQVENNKKIEDSFILGEGHFIAGFEDNLKGMAEGQEKEFSLLFPKEHTSLEMAGKNVEFGVKLKSVKKVELPEISDQFAQGLGKFSDLAGLKQNLRDGISLEKENQERERMRQEILEKIAEKSEMEIPAVLISSEQHRLMEELKQNVSQKLEMTFSDYLAKAKKTEKELSDSFLPEVEKRVKNSLTLREISKREKIEVSDGEAEAEANKILKANLENQKLDPERLKDYTKEVLRNEKTFAKLESFAMPND
jgi:trigger factor